MELLNFLKKAMNQHNSSKIEDHITLIYRVADILKEMGLQPGDKLLLVARNSSIWQAIEHGAICYGMEVVALEPHLGTKDFTSILGDEKFDLIVCESVHTSVLQNNTKEWILEIESFGQQLEFKSGQSKTALALEGSQRKKGSIRIYTSGTTDTPQPITYTEDQLISAITVISERISITSDARVTISWLPMANLFQRVLNLVALDKGFAIHFLGDPTQILGTAKKVHPTFLIAVPRFLEKIHRTYRLLLNRWPRILHKLIAPILRSIVKRQLGGQLEYIVCGSAKCSKQVLDFFEQLGITVLEAYGMSECILPISMNTPSERVNGSVGQIFQLHDYKISKKGELLIKSPFISSSFMDSDRIDSEGYLNTYDRVSIDSKGFVQFLGRSNDLVKTSTGRKVSLSTIEQAFSLCAEVSTAVAIAEGRPFPSLIVDCEESLSKAERKELLTKLQEVNKCLPAKQQVGEIIISQTPITFSSGLLTRNLKVKRNRVIAENLQLLNRVYNPI